MEKKSQELEVAIQAALEAGKILEKHFETDILKELKEDKSVVTLADKESEEVIKKIISKSFPDHSILGEETGINGKMGHQSAYIWYVDPVDGTTNFANGIPIFAISIALVHEDKVQVGVVYNPATSSLFYAERGMGAYLNDKKITVSNDGPNSCIVTTSARNKDDKRLARELMYRLPEKIRSIRNLGSTAAELAYVARGGIEANFQLGLNPYDFAAGTLLVEEAGGKITKLDGSPWAFPGNYFIASNGIIDNLLVEEVKKQKEKLGIQ